MIFDGQTPEFDTSTLDGRRQRMAYKDKLEDEITMIAGHINAIDYRFIKLLGEFDKHEWWVGDGIKSFAHWLNWRCGLGYVAAREKIRVARALLELPKIDEAFREGRVSYSKVRAMTRAATPENEHLLLDIGLHGTAEHAELAVRHYKRVRLVEAFPGEHEWKRETRFACWQDDLGMFHITARMPAEDGAIVEQAVAKMLDQVREAQKATKESASEGENVSAETSSDPYQNPGESFATHAAEALVGIADHFLATTDDSIESVKARPNAERYHVVVHVNANDAHLDCKINGGDATYLERGKFLAPPVVRKLACDAAVTTVLENDEGDVLNIGRRSRIVPRRIGMAVDMRDHHCCQYPGCYQTRFTDKHHIVHWADGGETSVENLITLCRYHHTRLHNGDYFIRWRGRTFEFFDSTRRLIPRSFDPQFPNAPTPDEALQKCYEEDADLNITSCTAGSNWDGGHCDYNTFIGRMLQTDGL